MSDDLVDRLNGKYRVPVNDGAGLLNGLDYFERQFPTSPLAKEAATALTEARAEIERWAAQALKEEDCREMWRTRALAAESELSTLRARVREVVGPFAKYIEVTDSDWAHDSSEIGCTIVNGLRHSIKLGHLRAARQLNEDLKDA